MGHSNASLLYYVLDVLAFACFECSRAYVLCMLAYSFAWRAGMLTFLRAWRTYLSTCLCACVLTFLSNYFLYLYFTHSKKSGFAKKKM